MGQVKKGAPKACQKKKTLGKGKWGGGGGSKKTARGSPTRKARGGKGTTTTGIGKDCMEEVKKKPRKRVSAGYTLEHTPQPKNVSHGLKKDINAGVEKSRGDRDGKKRSLERLRDKPMASSRTRWAIAHVYSGKNNRQHPRVERKGKKAPSVRETKWKQEKRTPLLPKRLSGPAKGEKTRKSVHWETSLRRMENHNNVRKNLGENATVEDSLGKGNRRRERKKIMSGPILSGKGKDTRKTVRGGAGGEQVQKDVRGNL